MPVSTTSVLARAAAHLNDVSQVIFTNDILLPFLKMAVDELAAEMRVFEITPLIMESGVLNIAIGATEITVPADFIDAINLLERPQGSTQNWTEPKNVVDIDDNLNITPLESIVQWTVRNKRLLINTPASAREVKLDYLRGLIEPTDSNNLDIDEARWFLGLVTAKNTARDIGNSATKAASFESDITRSRDRLIRGLQKQSQSIMGARRKAYRGRNR